MTSISSKPVFNGAPARAVHDASLTPVDHRVLGAIALHDRFNNNGQGCWASNARLAEVAGCHPNSVPRSITRLIEKGYVRDLAAIPGRPRTRRRQLVVIYTEEDRRFFVTGGGNHQRDLNQLVNLKLTAAVNRRSIEELTQKHCSLASEESFAHLPKHCSHPKSRAIVSDDLSKQERARYELAMRLGNGDVAKGFMLLQRIPDSTPTRRSRKTRCNALSENEELAELC
jgi:hypothetical protein